MELTSEAILSMPAGPELDELVGARILPWSSARRPYSTDIAAAWKVVIAVSSVSPDGSSHWAYRFDILPMIGKEEPRCWAEFTLGGWFAGPRPASSGAPPGANREWYLLSQAPLAICRAALVAVEGL